MKDRIKQLMESQHMTQQTFSDFIGISSASLSSIFNGRTKPTLNTVEAIRSKFTKINIEWLMYGTGSMFREGDTAGAGQEVSGVQPGTEPMIDFDNAYPSPVRSGHGKTGGQNMDYTPQGNVRTALKYIDKPQRQITEIRIFFDDQTYESFVPKK